jgi:hypothetical protein
MGCELTSLHLQREVLKHIIVRIHSLCARIPYDLALLDCQRVDQSRIFSSCELVGLTLWGRGLKADSVLCRSRIVGFLSCT